MDYHHETTTLRPGASRELTAWQDLGAGTPPTCSPPPSRARKTVPRAIHEIVAELKVRFQHTCGDDPEGFKARVGLLAEDLADAPPLILRRAVVEWVRTSPFLPTAADLIRLMREALEARDGGPRTAAPAGFHWADHVATKRNAEMAADPHARQDVEWVVVNGSPVIQRRQP